MDFQVLSFVGQKIFGRLGQLESLSQAYLGGGTALALQLNHRRSYDFDFFASKLPRLTQWQQDLSAVDSFRLLHTHSEGYFGVLNGIQISINAFPYPMLGKLQESRGLKVAGLRDLAAMKLFALLTRTRKKDIADLYFLAQSFSLEEMLFFFEHKFEGLQTSESVLLKALTDLKNLADEPLDLIKPTSWDAIKTFWENAVRRHVQEAQPGNPGI